ncbi:two-component system response regulator [Kitasatospora indigofera]|uniref:response regulator n=1 Tax=Kitasatospora indigofera TaxID=67307 RepID=UPI00369D41FB
MRSQQIKRRANPRNIPIIFLTAIGTSTEHSFRGYALGAVDFLVKPCDPWILRAKVTAFTEMHVAPDPPPGPSPGRRIGLVRAALTTQGGRTAACRTIPAADPARAGAARFRRRNRCG